MNIYAFICTRTKDFSPTLKDLISYLSRAGVKPTILVNQKSIYTGYKKAFKSVDVEDDDICIMCHDDIKIFNDPKEFTSILLEKLYKNTTGFVGVAGTTYLSEDAVWWNKSLWNQGKHSGLVFHVQDNILETTFYGNYREVVCLDGLFLATTGRVLNKIGLAKPSYFEGEWDFYDIHYTITARKQGLRNFTVPLFIKHESIGELVGRDSWHKNREAFIKNTPLPIVIR